MSELPAVRSLFECSQSDCNEVIESIVSSGTFMLEHIESHGAGSPPGFWYDQDKPEWVALIRGEAVLEFETGVLELRAGDSLEILAHVRHRVTSTSSDAVWLALHYQTDRTKQDD
jgi:cupin 2 domain-containing protein